jgi:hypothetical protein
MKTDEKTTRYREYDDAPPQGRENKSTRLVRVIETTGEIPEGCEPTTDEPHGWKVTD